jgi:hypothetical protein
MQTLILCAFGLYVSIGLLLGFILTIRTQSETRAEKFEQYLAIFRSRQPKWTDQRVRKIAEYYAVFERSIVMLTSAIFWPMVLVQVRRLWGKNAGV